MTRIYLRKDTRVLRCESLSKLYFTYNSQLKSVPLFTSIKFKAQYNNSPLVFEGYFEVKDMIRSQSHFALILDSNKVIKFCGKEEFIKKLVLYVEGELKELDDRFNELQRIASEERFVDENQLFYEHEEIGYKGAKYNTLLKKFNSF